MFSTFYKCSKSLALYKYIYGLEHAKAHLRLYLGNVLIFDNSVVFVKLLLSCLLRIKNLKRQKCDLNKSGLVFDLKLAHEVQILIQAYFEICFEKVVCTHGFCYHSYSCLQNNINLFPTKLDTVICNIKALEKERNLNIWKYCSIGRKMSVVQMYTIQFYSKMKVACFIGN